MAYGFVDWKHLASQRIEDVSVAKLWDAVRASAAEHNREITTLMATMVQRTTEYKVRFMSPGAGSLQPLDIYGDANPKTFRAEGYYDVAFPLHGAGTAWGTNIVSRAKMTVDEANRLTLDVQNQDADWMRRHIMAAVLDNVAWTFTDPDHGSLTVEPLANSDSVTYPKIGGSVATDEHYLYQAAAIADATSPFGTMYSELNEHVSNSGPYVAYISTSLVATTKALTAFVPIGDSAIAYGASTDQVRSPLPLTLGDEVLGRVENMWVVEWRNMPAGYIIAQAQGAGPFLRMRENAEAELQGLFTRTFSIDSNHEGIRYYRYAGFGVYDRTAACVMQVGNGSYSIPSGYNAPLSS